MPEPKRRVDECRYCGVSVHWEKRRDPDEVPEPLHPRENDQNIYDGPEYEEYKIKYKAHRDWYSRRKRWHNVALWWHHFDDGTVSTYCDPNDEKNDPFRGRKGWARHFCNDSVNKHDYYGASPCNKPVTYERESEDPTKSVFVCGIHAKPYKDAEERALRMEQRRAEAEAREEGMAGVIKILEEMGLKPLREKKYARFGGSEETGRIALFPYEIIRLLEDQGHEVERTDSSVPDTDVADGPNPFIDAFVDEDEEVQDEEWIEL